MKSKILRIVLVFVFLGAVSVQAAQQGNEKLYDFLRQVKDGKGGGTKKFSPPVFLSEYIKYVYSKDKKLPITAEAQLDFLFQIIDSAYYPEKFEKKWRDQLKNDRDKAFFFLALARNTIFYKEENFALKFFFQSFLFFTTWKDSYSISDKIVFINEWFYHFNASFASFKDSVDQYTYEYYTNLIISCTDLLYNIPYYFLIHPKTDYSFINEFIKTNSEMLSKIDDQYKLISMDKFKYATLKMFLVTTVLFMSERNYLKADLFSTKLITYFNNAPITENMFLIYEETLKNKILLNLKLSRVEQSAVFLNKYLNYSQACNKLTEKWNEIKEILISEEKYDEMLKNPKIKKILSDYKISLKQKKSGKIS